MAASFFASLQPLVVPITCLGMLMMYVTKRAYLYMVCKRPLPDFQSILRKMYIWISAGPLFFAVGHFIFYLLQNPANKLNFINIASIVVSALFLIYFWIKQNKKNVIFKKELKSIWLTVRTQNKCKL